MINTNLDVFLSNQFNFLEGIIRTLSSINKNDSAIELENFLIPVFNVYFQSNFINQNTQEKNYPGIDLYSKKDGIAIQITINASSQKKRDSLEQVANIIKKKKLKIQKFYIFTLTHSKTTAKFDDTPFFNKGHLLNITSILNLDISKKESIKEYFESFYSKNFNAKFLKYRKLVDMVFVQTKSYERAVKGLEDNNVVILNGLAGTGKTITSYKLLFDCIKNEFIYITSLNDIPYFVNAGGKYVLFVDDAISPTDINNADFKSVEETFSSIHLASPSLKVILNSRTNIIKSFDSTTSKLNLSQYNRYMISTDNITEIEKLNILENHVLFSFEKSSLQTLFSKGKKGESYLIHNIIKHKDFNPRIIEHFRKESKEVNPNLANDIIRALDNPDLIYWDQYKQLNEIEKLILELASVYGKPISTDSVLSFFTDLIEHEVKAALNNLDQSFLLQTELSNDTISYDFYNPGIRDFCEKLARQNKSTDHYLEKISECHTVLKLLSFSNVLKENKIKAISSNPEKQWILRYATTFNEEIYENFKPDLLDIIAKNGEVPYRYDSIISEEDRAYLESKYDDKDRKYIDYRGISKYLSHMIESDSIKLASEVVMNKIAKDYKNTVYSNIIGQIDDFIYKNKNEWTIEDTKNHFDDNVNSLIDNFEEKFISQLSKRFLLKIESDVDKHNTLNFSSLVDKLDKNANRNFVILINYLNDLRESFIEYFSLSDSIENSYSWNSTDEGLNDEIQNLKNKVDSLE